MKNFKISSVLVLIILGLLILIINCSKSPNDEFVDPLIMEFIKSKDFQLNELLSCKSIDFNKSNVKYLEGCKERPIINIFFKENEKIIATVEAIKNTNKNIQLPNDNKYFMLYRDFTRFDFNSLQGQINLYDLNYDNWLFGRGEILNHNLINSDYYSIPMAIIRRYEDVIKRNQVYIDKVKSEFGEQNLVKSEPILCDLNSNGNVSYSECFKCFNEACKSEATCAVLCYFIGDYIGQRMPPGLPLCQTSIAGACVYISIVY